MIAPEQRKLLPFGNHPEMLPMLEQQLRLLEENIQRENQVITHIDQGTAQRNQLSTANLSSKSKCGFLAGLLGDSRPSSSAKSTRTSKY
ncbi:hypothetical protein E2C01_086723 [Portunus trituberculatus]|uniref:Uncharacterized protein n=1 Tax=Portunus trituberculatus TaxID=210409 RepID=A0A5B7J4K6_PORTR|nr:hypothetical protein [Portunus trituberculatus]